MTLSPLRLLALASLLAVGCAPNLGNDDDDTGADDDDTGADDDDTGADDDDTGADDDDDDVCGIEDAILTLEVIDADGASGGPFPQGAFLTVRGLIENICPFDVIFETNSGCLLEPWSLSGSNSGMSRGCDDAITTWVLPDRSTLIDAEAAGALEADTYTFSAGFLDQSGTLQFTVLGEIPPG